MIRLPAVGGIWHRDSLRGNLGEGGHAHSGCALCVISFSPSVGIAKAVEHLPVSAIGQRFRVLCYPLLSKSHIRLRLYHRVDALSRLRIMMRAMIRSINELHHKGRHSFQRGTDFPFWTFSWLQQGGFELCFGDRRTFIGAPAFVIRRPNIPYALTTPATGPGTRELFALFVASEDLMPLLSWPFIEDGHVVIRVEDVSARKEIVKSLHQALDDWTGFHNHKEQLALNSLKRALILLAPFNPQRAHLLRDARINTALEYLRAHYAEKIDVSKLARLCGLSPSHFAHLFRAEMQLTPKQQLEILRLDRAAERLVFSSDPIEEIAYEVGFESAAHFSRRFKNRFRIAPRFYRESRWHAGAAPARS